MSVTQQLSTEEIQALRSILGQPVIKLYSPYLEVCRLWYSAPHFSVPIGGNYIVVESDWAHTPKESLDYHIMHVSTAGHPRGAPKVLAETGGKMIGSPVSTVEIGPPKSGVVSVTLLERQEIGREEAVLYDSGLVFTLADGRRFVLGVRESIAGGLECSTDPVAIDELISENSIHKILS